MSRRKKIMLTFGTRPEAIKMAPLAHMLKKNHDKFDPIICVTAQHRHMLDQVLNVFDVTPDVDLDVMTPGQDLFDVTARILINMRQTIADRNPDIVLVHGDTTTAFAAATACFYAGVPVGHVEAGLRSGNLQAPFPEEFNRKVVSTIAKWHFAPTVSSRQNLISEGVSADTISVTGNTVIDALQWILNRLDGDATMRSHLEARLHSLLPFSTKASKFVLITGHRRENFGEGFLDICSAIKDLAISFPKVQFVYPVHLNPNVRRPVHELLYDLENVHIIEPLEYHEFVYLLHHSYMVMTDSGGIQEEAPSLGKPVLVMRDLTERPEAIAAGTVELVGAKRCRIVDSATKLLKDPDSYLSMSRAHNPYGDGKACQRILDFLANT